jgi:hypothetical protein
MSVKNCWVLRPPQSKPPIAELAKAYADGAGRLVTVGVTFVAKEAFMFPLSEESHQAFLTDMVSPIEGGLQFPSTKIPVHECVMKRSNLSPDCRSFSPIRTGPALRREGND